MQIRGGTSAKNYIRTSQLSAVPSHSEISYLITDRAWEALPMAETTTKPGEALMGFVLLGALTYFAGSYFFGGPSEAEIIKALPQAARLDRVISATLTGNYGQEVPKISHDGGTTTVVTKCKSSGSCGFEMITNFNNMVVMAKEVDAPLAGKKFDVAYTTALVDKYGNAKGDEPLLSIVWNGDELAKVQKPSSDTVYIIAALADVVKFGRFGKEDYNFICKEPLEGSIARFCLKATAF